MLKTLTLLATVLSLILFPVTKYQLLAHNGKPVPAKVITESSFDFSISRSELAEQHVQLYMLLLDKSLKPVYSKDKQISFQKDIRPLDYLNYWDKKQDERYYVLLTKAAYIVNTPVSFFTEKRLSDVNYIQETLPDYKVQSDNGKTFKIACGFMAPDFTYDLTFSSPDQDISPQIQELIAYTAGQDTELGTPKISVVQHNYDFSRVMMHKTNKMSVSVTNIYDYGNNQTLQVNYTLNYIHNLPPELLGGSEMLIGEIRKGIFEYVNTTRKYIRQM
ncbi:hypothetical protein V6R21_07105 [Limibacter armeniacum]|uniref:hypothetical protein n=1 Tax=Limibacter armeniacum TaxID=466084 RepID=UPI002FE69C76